jgi:hypothetical protein
MATKIIIGCCALGFGLIVMHSAGVAQASQLSGDWLFQSKNTVLAETRRMDRRDDRGDRRDNRGEGRDTRQDCRQEEGLAGSDKRECKKEGSQEKSSGDGSAD